MDRREAVKKAAHRLRQQFVGQVHVRKEGVAAARGRGFGHVEHGAERRNLIASHVRMPTIACGVGGIGGGLDRENLRVAPVGVLHRMHMQRAEPAAKRLVLLTVEMLVAEHQHLPIPPSIADVLGLLVGQRLRQVHAAHFGADVGRQ